MANFNGVADGASNGVPEAQADGAGSSAPVEWRLHEGRRAVVRASAGSYSEKRAPGELRQAERAVEALEKLLSPAPEKRGEPIEIYLVDDTSTASASDSGSGTSPGSSPTSEVGGENNAIVRRVQPEAPGAPVAFPIAHRLTARWFGPSAATLPLLLDGLAGYISAGESGPSLKEADDQVRQAMAAGQQPSIFSRPNPSAPSAPSGAAVTAPPVATGATPAPTGPPASASPAPVAASPVVAATSFVAFLLSNGGGASLRRFLELYDPERRDQAAVEVYQRPLGVLEELWLSGLRRQVGGGAFKSLMAHLIPLLKPHWPRQMEVFAYMAVGVAYSLAVPAATKYLLNALGGFINAPAASRGDADAFASRVIVPVVVALFLAYAFNAGIAMRRALVSNTINYSILLGLQKRVFTHMQRLPHTFYGRAKVGDLMLRLTSDMQMVQGAMSQLAGTGVYQAVIAIAVAVYLLCLNPILGALVLIVVPVFAVSFFALRTRFQIASREQQKRAGEAVAGVQENLTSHAVIKAFGLESRAVDAYSSRLDALRAAAMRLVGISAMSELTVTFAITLGQILVLGAGGYLVLKGRMSIGDLGAFIVVLPQLFGPVSALSGVAQSVQTASGALDRINELLDEPVSIEDKPQAAALPPLAREIRLEKVSFGYGDRPILRDLSLTIPAGANVAFVGPSGCGKSTTVNLILRFWDPQEGRVLCDGHDLQDVTLASLRGQIGLVFQDTIIFDTTLRENIAIGRPDASDAEIAAAARAARLDSYIETLPAGYDTVLGERGVRMSGGQRQRLAIARVVLRDPRILILDEATSALDTRTEREIWDTLDELSKGRTTISITHRLASAAKADRIYVLDQGQLAEEGTHDELMARDGLYAKLQAEQTGESAEGRDGAAAKPPVAVEAARLKSVPLFGEMGPRELEGLAARLMLERFAPGEEIVRQNAPGDRLYILSSGQAEAVVADGSGERRVNVLNEGDYFGETALLSGQPRNATVRATMPTQLLSLGQKDFQLMVDHVPAIREAVTQTMDKRRAVIAAVPSPAASTAGERKAVEAGAR